MKSERLEEGFEEKRRKLTALDVNIEAGKGDWAEYLWNDSSSIHFTWSEVRRMLREHMNT